MYIHANKTIFKQRFNQIRNLKLKRNKLVSYHDDTLAFFDRESSIVGDVRFLRIGMLKTLVSGLKSPDLSSDC